MAIDPGKLQALATPSSNGWAKRPTSGGSRSGSSRGREGSGVYTLVDREVTRGGKTHRQGYWVLLQEEQAELLSKLWTAKKTKLEKQKSGGRFPPGKTPEEHIAIARRLVDLHERSLDQETSRLQQLAAPTAVVSARAKDLESVIGKLDRKADKYKDANDLQDMTGLRVVCDSLDEVHENIASIEKNYEVVGKPEDYISKPLGDYRSYHLNVKGEGGQVMEVQVRTKNQHAFAVWAHTVYKPKDEAQAMMAHHPDTISYSNRMSEWFWAQDSGRAPGPQPKCPETVRFAFGVPKVPSS